MHVEQLQKIILHRGGEGGSSNDYLNNDIPDLTFPIGLIVVGAGLRF